MEELVKQFRRACTIASLLAARGSVCLAHNLGLDLLILAKFKYLLPDEIMFEYEDTPSDTIFGSAPHQVLIFAFKDKTPRRRTVQQTTKIILERIDRFEQALSQFITRRKQLATNNWETNLNGFARQYLPSADPFDEPIGELTVEAAAESTEQLFDKICEPLENIISTTTTPKKEPIYAPVPERLVDYVDRDQLWSHQSRALLHLLESPDNHLVVSTATASGKSLIFHSIVKYGLAEVHDSTALFIYPTKALAQDQLRSFKRNEAYKVTDLAYTFDGDTPFEERNKIQKLARVLFVNPDILHTTILPNWERFDRFLGNLRYVVIDELHYYTGVFGANVGLVLRRLRRMCAQLGAECQFIGCSATVTDPRELLATLTGVPEDRILELGPQDDGSETGSKKYVFCTPEFLTPDDPSSGRMHPIKEAAPLLVRMVRNNLRVIAFCRFRRECELLLRAVYEIDGSLRQIVRGYRGGYNAKDRREIEALMFSDNLKGIVATSALEVGIDIGSLDAAIIVGFPHSIASFRQQVGRVGRRQRDSLVVYIATGSVLDQNYASNPQKVLHEDILRAPVLLHDSIVRSHLQAAAFEQALDKSELDFFPSVKNFGAMHLTELDNLMIYERKPSINLRKADDEHEDTAVIDVRTNKVLEHVEFDRVSFTLYEGAIFIHQGKAYLVVHLDPDLMFARVQRTHVKWITRVRDFTDVDPLATNAFKQLKESTVVIGTGSINVTTHVFGYFKFNENHQIIDQVEVNLPPNVSIKTGCWLNLPHYVLSVLKERKHYVAASIHAAEHVIISVLPLLVSMAPGDVGTECKAPEKELFAKRPSSRLRAARLIFYEKYGGKLGNGILDSAYLKFDEILKAASTTVDGCPCETGCESCIGSGYCVEHNAVLSKNGARVILRLFRSLPVDGIPEGPDENMPENAMITVVPVEAHTMVDAPLNIERCTDAKLKVRVEANDAKEDEVKKET